jgi:ubiquinone/menaquinone biosynthesis C-methylase UbiE
MKPDFGSDKLSAFQAKTEAQKIAFAPVMFQAARSMRELGILEALAGAGGKGLTSKEISEKTGLSIYGVEVLLDAGLSMGMAHLKNGRYILTKTGFFVLRDTLTKVNMDFVHYTCYKAMFYLADSVKEGKPEGLKVLGDWETVYKGLTELPGEVSESWFGFDHFYSDQVFHDVLPIVFEGNPSRIMDVGGNTGKWARICLQYNSAVELTIVDLPKTLGKALELAEDEPYSPRLHGYAMNVLDTSREFPEGFDVIWMSQFLDCFSAEEIVSILSRAARAMSPGSSLLILELFWDRQKYEASSYSLNATSLYFTCVANGNSRMYHSEEFFGLVDKAGLNIELVADNLGISHTLLKCRKK